MPLLFSYSIKKVQKNGLDFCQNAKTLILEPFLGRLGPDPSGVLSKITLRRFSYFMTLSNFIQKIRKNWWVNSDIMRCERTDGRMNGCYVYFILI